MILGIIPCSKEKIWDIKPNVGPVKAKDAYRSAFHQYARAYALKNCSHHIIFSAKYGFMEPDFIISGPYDVTFNRPQDPCILDADLMKQAQRYAHFKTVAVLCPKTYANKIEISFSKTTAQLVYPLRGVGGWGAMHTWLKQNA